MVESIPPEAPRPQEGRRARASRGPVIAVAALCVLVLGVAGFFGYQAFDRRMTAARGLDRATALLRRADDAVVAIDKVVQAQVTPDLAAQATEAGKRVASAQDNLAEATNLIDRALPGLTDDERKRAGLLRAAVQARADMLQTAPPVLAFNEQASEALPLARAGWKAMLEADALSEKAVKSYNKLTRAGVSASGKLNKQVAGKLAIARDAFDGAEQAFPQAPFETYLAYVDARLTTNKISQQSNTYWLANKIAEANKLIDSYNEADRRAVEQIKALPSSPEAAVAAAFESATANLEKKYYAARERAIKADKSLSAY